MKQQNSSVQRGLFRTTALGGLLALAAVFAPAAAPQPASAAATASGVRLEVFLEPLDGQGWQWYFLADTVRRRLDGAGLKVYPLIVKNTSGQFEARRGEAELAEGERMAVILRKYPGKLPLYLSARSMSPAADGWRDAALFAGLNPDELEKLAAVEGRAALEESYKAAQAAGAAESSLYLGGRRYDKAQRLLPLYEAVNAALPSARRLPPPAGYTPRPKPAPPGFWVVLSSGGAVNQGLVAAFDRYFEGIKPEVLDYGAPASAARFPELNFLPSYVLAATPDARAALKKELEAGLFVEKDGYLVYEDRGLGGIYPARGEKSNTLELFVMSQCPYGVAAENALLEAQKAGQLPEGLKLEVHYIGDAAKDGKGGWAFNSLHGQPEWEENARQLYIISAFPEKLGAYLLERNKDYKAGDWKKAAAAAGLSPEAVTKGEQESRSLLAADFAATSALGISSSPSFILDGKRLVTGLGELAKLPGFEKIAAVAPAAGQAGAAAGCAK